MRLLEAVQIKNRPRINTWFLAEFSLRVDFASGSDSKFRKNLHTYFREVPPVEVTLSNDLGIPYPGVQEMNTLHKQRANTVISVIARLSPIFMPMI